MSERQLLGYLPVDSGQVSIVNPAHIELVGDIVCYIKIIKKPDYQKEKNKNCFKAKFL